mgnify:CR=1 FL=1
MKYRTENAFLIFLVFILSTFKLSNLQTKIPSSKINNKIQDYANEFVICKDCNKPDTKILKEGRIDMLKCTACGAKHPIKTKI